MKLELANSSFTGVALSIACTAGCGGLKPISDNPDAAGYVQNHVTAAQWARTTLGPTTSSRFSSNAVDSSGNLYAVGEIRGTGTLDFGNGVTATSTSSDYSALLLKYDALGKAQWVRTSTVQLVPAGGGSSYSSQLYSSVALDASGNVYVAGHLSGATGIVDLGNGVTVTKSDTFNNGVLVKYDASGSAQWAHVATDGSGHSYFNSVAVDALGNVLVAGEIDGTGTYGFGNSVTATGVAINDGVTSANGSVTVARNVVLAKYDSSGVAQWAQTVTAGAAGSSFTSVAVDSTGHVYAAGSINDLDTYDFGNGVKATGSASLSHIPGQVPSVVLVKYNASGIAQWAQTDTAAHGSVFSSVAIDSTGNVYAAGVIGGSESFDFGSGVTVTGTLNSDAFVSVAGPQFVVLVKYDASGGTQWARTGISVGPNSSFNSVAVDSSGNVYVAGELDGIGTYDFGNNASVTVNNDGSNYCVLVKYDASGIAQLALSSVNGGSSGTTFDSVTVDSTNAVYTAGGIGGAGVVDFGNGVTVTGTQEPSPGWSTLLVRYQ